MRETFRVSTLVRTPNSIVPTACSTSKAHQRAVDNRGFGPNSGCRTTRSQDVYDLGQGLRKDGHEQGELDRARVSIENGKYNRALPDLWVVEATCRRTNIDLARQLRETATDVRHQATGRTRRECDTLVDHVEANIHGMERAHEARLNDPRPRGAGGHSRL